MSDLGLIKIIESPPYAGEALIDSVVGRSCADVVAGRLDGFHDLRRS